MPQRPAGKNTASGLWLILSRRPAVIGFPRNPRGAGMGECKSLCNVGPVPDFRNSPGGEQGFCHNAEK